MRFVRELFLCALAAAVVLGCYILAAGAALFTVDGFVPDRGEQEILHDFKSGRSQLHDLIRTAENYNENQLFISLCIGILIVGLAGSVWVQTR